MRFLIIRTILLLSVLVTVAHSCGRISAISALTELTIQPQVFPAKHGSGPTRGFQIRCRAHKVRWEKLTTLTLQRYDPDAGSYIDLVISSEGEFKNQPSRSIWANIKSGLFSGGHAVYKMDEVHSSGGKRELVVEFGHEEDDGDDEEGYGQYRCIAHGIDADGADRMDISPRAFISSY